MKKLPGNVSVEKTYRDDDRDALLKRIRELEIELRRTEMARDGMRLTVVDHEVDALQYLFLADPGM